MLVSAGHPQLSALDEADVKYWVVGRDQARRERALAQRRGDAAAADVAPSALDGVPFGQPALALAAQLQRRAARAGVPKELARLDGDSGSAESADSGGAELADSGEDIGRELFRLVSMALQVGRDAETELRAAACSYRDLVRAWELGQHAAGAHLDAEIQTSSGPACRSQSWALVSVSIHVPVRSGKVRQSVQVRDKAAFTVEGHCPLPGIPVCECDIPDRFLMSA